MVEHTPSEQAEFTPNRVQREILRIQRLFVPSQGDKEDILSYARHVVGIERERDEALTNGHDRIAELNAEAKATSARIAALEGALRPLSGLYDQIDDRDADPDTDVFFQHDGTKITFGDIRRARAALASTEAMKGE